jgi:CheY-like chemotaxis protein
MPSRVLIVEDEPDIRDLLAFHLEREGYQVSKCRTGADALRQISAVRPDLVLLDLMLPEIDGLEVCRRLRREPRTASLPDGPLHAAGHLRRGARRSRRSGAARFGVTAIGWRHGCGACRLVNCRTALPACSLSLS